MMPKDWEPEQECKIGSVPWFCGIFWLAISLVASGLARLFCKAYCLRLSYLFIVLSNKACAVAARCAFEGGAKL